MLVEALQPPQKVLFGATGGIRAAISRLSQTDLRLSVPSGGVDTQHVPDIWEQPIPPPLPPPPTAGLLGTAYLCPPPYQIVDTERYPGNDKIFSFS